MVTSETENPLFQRVNAVYPPLTVPIAQAFLAVEEKGLITRLRSWRNTSQCPKSDKFCRFHNDYGHTTEECRHLKNEIERLIQNFYLKEYVCWERARGTDPYQKKEGDKAREVRAPSPGRPSKEELSKPQGARRTTMTSSQGSHTQDSRRTFRRRLSSGTKVTKRSGPQIIHNDALVIMAIIANYEVGLIFIDSGSSANILFGEAYDQMQLGDVSLEKVNTSLYEFAGEVVHPRGMVSPPLTMGRGTTRKTCLLKFLVVDVPSTYNVILGRPTLNTFQAVVSTYHMKINFPTPRGVGEVQGDPLQSRKCYVEAVRKGQKWNVDDAPDQVPPSRKGKMPEEENLEETETPAKVQPAEELLNIEIIPGNPDKNTQIGSHLGEEPKKEITLYLQRNADIFAWTPQDLDGIDPQVITHHLNIDPSYKLVKQKKRHFGPEKDKIIQAEVNKLMAAGHIEEIQFPEWLSNVVLVPKPGGKWRMCIDFPDLNRACPKDFYPLSRIDQLVDSTSGCELLSMMDASQGYHQIMLAPEDRKKVSFITSESTFYYVAMPISLKNAGATYQRLVDKIFRPQLGQNVEVYVDGMLVKSQKTEEHVKD
ncbi:UNVERIFIED_CONTAM: Retrovirus-related Pol polyprotein from transposon [Sesamum radiatum]|uniref:Retrovirus-related Pol polyprotein from transposon n=1 Tax=Sesamum radiatum TaxID=300843 RepID=A0AAW2IM26_SESRA